MDISGVDVDYLNDEEILELCEDIADTNTDEIFVLKKIDIDNLPEEKIQEVYDNVLYNVNKPAEKVIYLTDKQVLDNNFNIVDVERDEIVLLSGHNANVDINNLSDDEIIAMYDKTIENENEIKIAALNCGYSKANEYTHLSLDGNYLVCYDETNKATVTVRVVYNSSGYTYTSYNFWESLVYNDYCCDPITLDVVSIADGYVKVYCKVPPRSTECFNNYSYSYSSKLVLESENATIIK